MTKVPPNIATGLDSYHSCRGPARHSRAQCPVLPLLLHLSFDLSRLRVPPLGGFGAVAAVRRVAGAGGLVDVTEAVSLPSVAMVKLWNCPVNCSTGSRLIVSKHSPK